MEDPAVPVFKRRAPKKTAIRKTEESHSASASEDEDGRVIKRTKLSGGGVSVSSKQSIPEKPIMNNNDDKFSADRTTTLTSNDDATRTSNWQKESATLSENFLLGKSSTQKQSANGDADGPVYKGKDSYTTHITTNPDKTAKSIGPVKAPANVRTITVTDFAPDVCKDYKQTGYCGFGDSCKFLHAREDYKQGWQLDKDWENVNKGKTVANGKIISKRNKDSDIPLNDEEREAEEDKSLEGIPFVCLICKGPYKNPIQTKCRPMGHPFCETCALKRYKKDPGCAICGTDTRGLFSTAPKWLIKALERKRIREENKEKGDDEEESNKGGDS